MITSESIDKIAPALVKAQAAMQNAVKDSENEFFKNKDGKKHRYADLTAVLEACRAHFLAQGIAVLQAPGAPGTLTTRLLHESGQWIEETASAPLSKQDPQAVGSCVTYLRRYSLAAFANIGQEDDDGNEASGKSARSSDAKMWTPKHGPPPSQDDNDQLPEYLGGPKSNRTGGK